MISILLFGFLLGMRHAVEADHIAAVASLTSTTNSIRKGVQQGMAWGLGHTLTLFLFGSIVLFVANIVPEQIVSKIELAVGVMLIVLGGDVLRRVIADRVHFHTHSHAHPDDARTGDASTGDASTGDASIHFHAHSHKGEKKTEHDANRHQHNHPQGFPIRALLVGLVHGMAGSAALILLTLQTLSSPWLGLVYIAVFGIGSIAGMGLFSLVIALPLRAASRLTWLYNALQTIIGISTMALGAYTISQFS